MQDLVPGFMRFVTRPTHGAVLRVLAACLVVVAIVAAILDAKWAGFTPVVWLLLALIVILGVVCNELAQVIGMMSANQHAHAGGPLNAAEAPAPRVAEPVQPTVAQVAPKPKVPPAKPAGSFAFEVEIYCVKCRQKQTIRDPEMVTLANGRPAYQGSCPVCGTTVTRIRKAE